MKLPPLIVGIDPGPTESGFCIIETIDEQTPLIVDAGKIENEKIPKIFDYPHRPDLAYHVAIEKMVWQGQAFGKTSIETCEWIGYLRRVLEERNIQYFKYSRKEYGLWVTGGGIVNDSSIRAGLEDSFGGYAKKTDPLYYLRGPSDKRSAFAIAKYHEHQLRTGREIPNRARADKAVLSSDSKKNRGRQKLSSNP